MSGMKNFLGQDIFRVVFFLVIAAFLTVANTGCELLDEDDDNSSTGGAATAPTPPAPAAAPATEPEATASEAPSLSSTGIVWKPISEGDRKLVVLIPRNNASVDLSVLSPDGEEVIEEGRYVGRTNGDRPTYRFSRPGRDFPDNCLLRVGSKTFLVENPASRYN